MTTKRSWAFAPRRLVPAVSVSLGLLLVPTGCTDPSSGLDCDEFTHAFVSRDEGTKGARILDAVVEEYSAGGDRVDVVERFDAQAVLLVRRDGKRVALLDAANTGDGWHVSGVESCDGSDIGVREVG